jgi:hypothetical protein
MKDASPVSIELASDQVRYLEEMARKHGLPDIGKAVRCLVNYARDTPDREADIFAEVRCLDC